MKILERKTAYKGYYQVDELTMQSTISQSIVKREQFLAPNSVGVLAINTQTQKVILVKQFRVGPEQPLIEIVAGKVEGKDLDPKNTAIREVEEEIGYEVDELIPIYQFYTSPGPVTEMMDLFVAKVSKKVNSGGGLASEVEEIEILEWSFETFLGYTFNDAKTIMSQQWLQLHLGKFIH